MELPFLFRFLYGVRQWSSTHARISRSDVGSFQLLYLPGGTSSSLCRAVDPDGRRGIQETSRPSVPRRGLVQEGSFAESRRCHRVGHRESIQCRLAQGDLDDPDGHDTQVTGTR